MLLTQIWGPQKLAQRKRAEAAESGREASWFEPDSGYGREKQIADHEASFNLLAPTTGAVELPATLSR